jgi:hypothetical protein
MADCVAVRGKRTISCATGSSIAVKANKSPKSSVPAGSGLLGTGSASLDAKPVDKSGVARAL